MASPITFSGLASGLDTQSIIAALVAVEGRKVDLLRTQRTSFSDKIGAFDQLLDRLKDLETILGKLGDADRFQAHSITLSPGGEDHLTASLSGTAQAGTYELQVSALAESAFLRSDGFADPDAALGMTGTLSIQVGSTVTDITIDGTNDTLHGIRDAINSSGAEVTASVVYDGTDYHLELRGNESGAANAVTILSEPGQPPPLGTQLNIASIRAASDASFTIDGQAYTSASNTVTGAIEGVTLQLVLEQDPADDPIRLTVGANFDEIESQLQEFVDAYNDVAEFLNEQSTFTAGAAAPTLLGESSLRMLRSSLGLTIASQASTGSDYSSLGTVGIRLGVDGKLSLDSEKLTAALAADLDGVKDLFSHATEGVANKLLAVVELRTDSIDGFIEVRQDSLEESIETLDDRILAAEYALERFEESLVLKYSQLETLLTRLQSQGTALSGITTFGLTGTTTRR